MKELYADCCAVLLRGGRSRRMGTDKALLPWKGMTFLEAVARQLDPFEEKYLSVSADQAAGTSGGMSGEISGISEAVSGGISGEMPAPCGKVSVGSGKGEAGLFSDWILLPDRVADCGPAGGIYTALSVCRADWALVASCDIPAVRRSLFEVLLRNRAEDTDIVYPLTPDEHMHMTCALYHKSLLPLLERQIRAGDYRLRRLAELSRSRAVGLADPGLAGMLANINTREELAEALSREPGSLS